MNDRGGLEALVEGRCDGLPRLSLLDLGKDRDVEEAVVDESLGAEHVPAARLPAVADAQDEERRRDPAATRTGQSHRARTESDSEREDCRPGASAFQQEGPAGGRDGQHTEGNRAEVNGLTGAGGAEFSKHEVVVQTHQTRHHHTDGVQPVYRLDRYLLGAEQ